MPRLDILKPTIKKLFALSRNQCANPSCNKKLIISEKINYGEMAHIEGAEPDSPRYNKFESDEQRRSFENLLVLCANCHTMIDADEEQFTVAVLKKWKKDHETKGGEDFILSEQLLNQIFQNEQKIIQTNSIVGSGQIISSQQGNIAIQGISGRDVVDLFTVAIGANFPNISKSNEISLQRIEKFADTFTKIVSLKLTDSDRSKISDPDIKNAIIEALNVASRTDHEDLYKSLSILVSHRIKSDEDITRVVLNESIPTLSKLTNNQLKIMSLCFLLRYTAWNRPVDDNSLDSFLRSMILPLFPIKQTITEFDHMESVSCGKTSIGSWNPYMFFANSCSDAFRREFTDDEINQLNLKPELRNVLFESPNRTGICDCLFLNYNEFVRFLKSQNLEKTQYDQLSKFYESHLFESKLIEERLLSHTIGKQLCDFLNDENNVFKNLGLTSVGKAIAITYLEICTKSKFDLKIWIN